MPAGVNPNSRANLAKGKPTRFNSQTGSAAGKKGAPASARARAAKKTLAQLARTIADSPISDTKTRQSIESIGIHDDDLTNNALVVAGVFQGAATGNIAAVEKWETMLQRADEENGTGAGKKPFKLPAELIGKAFVDINRQIKPGNTYIFAGGRGSLKSTFVSQKCKAAADMRPFHRLSGHHRTPCQ